MAVPTVSTVTPATGNAGGGALLDVVGSNFALFTGPASGQSGTYTARVKVTVGGVEATGVRVYSATHLTAVVPAYTGSVDLDTFAAVAVAVANLDANGVEISGESASKAAAYTYRRQPLRGPTLDLEPPLVRITRQLTQMLKAQILADSGVAVHTDFSKDGISVKDAGQPALLLQGPSCSDDPYQERTPDYEEPQPDGSVLEHCQAKVHRLEYQIEIDSDNHQEAGALSAAVQQFFHRNVYLTMTADVPASTSLRLPMTLLGDVSHTTGHLESNVRLIRARFEVRRVPVLYLPPRMRTWPAATIELQVQTLTGTLVQTKTL